MVASINNGSSPLSYSNGTTMPLSTASPNSFVNVEKGDPVAFKSYWEKVSDKCLVEIKGEEFMSYIADANNLCWYMVPQMGDAILRLHNVVGNVDTKDKYLVLGTGSSQLYQALLYALSPSQSSHRPINIVAAAPYHSEYQEATNILQSRLFQWVGDAALYEKDEPYIEVVTSPNNPDGTLRGPVVKSNVEGKVIYDMAYYWPQYTPINMVDHDIMLFTLSKCTGHGGSRIGWAFVKDIEVAKKMIRFIHLNSIGVSRESQIRASKIIEVICDGYQNLKIAESDHLFFDYSKRLMKERWEIFKGAIEKSKVFILPKYPTSYCHFAKDMSEQYPAFAWLKCVDDIEDGEKYLEKLKIRVRGGKRFGVDAKYVRVSMIGTNDEFIELCTRLSNAKRE